VDAADERREMGQTPVPGRSLGSRLRAGDCVVVRAREAILATLDENGCLEGLPFMPEMLAFCGKRFRVGKRAHKTCDTVNKTGGRRMANAVHLTDVRCDGRSHGDCDAACLIFWKEAWLERVDERSSWADDRPEPGRCTQEQLHQHTLAPEDREQDPTYVCQATMLPKATTPLRWWDLRQYWEDYTSGNVTTRQLVDGIAYVCAYNLIRQTDRRGLRRLGVPAALVRLYDAWQALRGGVPFPRRWGRIPAGQKTPTSPPLDLMPGELVRIRPYQEILDTLDTRNRNRGLYFDAEEVPYCGNTYRVRSLVRKVVDEKTGKMLQMKSNTVILEGVYCLARYSDRRMFCPRAIFSFWREAWLTRVEEGQPPGTAVEGGRGAGES
jgi:hypothetical protein